MKKQKPYAPSADKNKDDILKVLKQIISPENFRLIEIGSGTGQHAVYMAPYFKNLQWVTTEVPAKHDGITMWVREAMIPNVHGPLRFEVGRDEFPSQKCDVVYAANLFHAMSWKDDKSLIKMLGNRLREGSKAIFYGAFTYGGKFASPNQESFHNELKAENPALGIRSFEDIEKAMIKAGFVLTRDFPMPADHHILYFTRLAHVKS